MDQSFASRVKGTVCGLDGCAVNLLYTSLIIIVLVLQPSGIIVCTKVGVAWHKLYSSFYLTLVRFFFFKFERLASCRDILLAIDSLSPYTILISHVT